MSERAFVCQLTLLNIDTYSNILIESSINTNEMFSRVNEKRIYVIDITFGINESIFSGNEQQKVYVTFLFEKRFLRKECKKHSIVCTTALVIIDKIALVVHWCYRLFSHG